MASNSIVDLKFMSKGGLLLDSDGDLAFTDSSMDSISDMVQTRLQAALYAFKQYAIGADLDNLLGNIVEEELEIAIQKQVTQSLTNDFLPLGSFTVTTLQIANNINVFVYIQDTLVATTTVTSN